VNRLQLSVVAASLTISLVLTSVCSVLADPHCVALLYNNTWDLVPRSLEANVITDKWIFKHKLKANGSLDW
jgi:hypothetical protein